MKHYPGIITGQRKYTHKKERKITKNNIYIETKAVGEFGVWKSTQFDLTELNYQVLLYAKSNLDWYLLFQAVFSNWSMVLRVQTWHLCDVNKYRIIKAL